MTVRVVTVVGLVAAAVASMVLMKDGTLAVIALIAAAFLCLGSDE